MMIDTRHTLAGVHTMRWRTRIVWKRARPRLWGETGWYVSWCNPFQKLITSWISLLKTPLICCATQG